MSESHPADHDWHCGLSFTMQDVNGVNFWGGRTYVRDRGYTWLGDQGAITHHRWLERSPGHLAQELVWAGPIVEPLEHPIEPVELLETRTLDWSRPDEHTWALDADLLLLGSASSFFAGKRLPETLTPVCTVVKEFSETGNWKARGRFAPAPVPQSSRPLSPGVHSW